MPKLIALLLCFLSLTASAQVKLSFSNTILSSKNVNVTTPSEMLQDCKLKSATDGYKVVSYVISILPKAGDLVGPFTITGGRDVPLEVKNVLPNSRGAKIYIDNIVVQNPDGRKFKSKNYVLVCR